MASSPAGLEAGLGEEEEEGQKRKVSGEAESQCVSSLHPLWVGSAECPGLRLWEQDEGGQRWAVCR